MTDKLKVSVVDYPFTVESWDKPGSNLMGMVNGKETPICAETVHQVSGNSIDGNRTIQIIVKSGNESDDAKLICDLLNDGLHLFSKTENDSSEEGSFLVEISDTPKEYSPLHVETYIDYGLMGMRDGTYDKFIKGTTEENHVYARWVLNYFRMSAILKGDFSDIMKDSLLFADYEGKRYRVTGASRFGDVWLHPDPEVSVGYKLRVPLDQLTNMSNSFS